MLKRKITSVLRYVAMVQILAFSHATTPLIPLYNKREDLPELVEETLHGYVEPVPEGLTPVRGYEFGGNAVDYHALLQSYRTCGFQATNFGLAVEQINQMVIINAACSNVK